MLALSSCLAAHAQEASRPLDGAGLVADVDLLERAYTRLHPGLYRYATPAQTRRRFDALRKELRGGATLADAFLALSRFSATVRCGHTQANFFNQSPALQKALLESGRTRLPFQFRWLEGRMVITRNGSSDASLVPGTQVKAIDGVPTATVLARLMPLARADGGNDSKRVAQMEVHGLDRYEAFDVYLALLYPEFGDNFRLRVRSPGDAADRIVAVRGFTIDERRAMSGGAGSEPNAPAWSLQHPRAGVALLRMPDWALYDSNWDWRADLRATFARLGKEGTTTLVIDLRGNEGGLSVGDELLAYLSARPLPLLRYRQQVRYRTVPAPLLPFLKTWDKSFQDWGEDAQPLDGHWFTLTRWRPADAADILQPKSPRFTGKVLVLVDAANSSATFEFANQLKASGLATLIGSTTGGNRRGINGSAFFFLTLPHSGIELDLPLVAQFPTTEQPDAGVEPDVRVVETAEDLAAGRDAVMEKAMSLAK
ncbi:peptidase S41 [Lysobacter sp. Root604]|nr:peptidase S41 [Lysobacter sp. Root604]